MSDPVRLAYLCLQATREGQASYAHVHEIIRGLDSRGYHVTLFEPGYARRNGALPGALGRALQFFAVQRHLRHDAKDAHAVYIRAHFAAAPTARWARRRGMPVVMEVNGAYEDLFTAWPWTRRFEGFFTRLMREQYRSADALITVTPGLASWLREETGRADVHVVTNGANAELFTPDAAPRGGLPKRYVVFMGSFAAWQGLSTLIAATEHAEWPEGVSLVIAGDGAERDIVDQAAADNPRVVYLGTIPYRQMPGLLAGSIAGMSPQGRGRGRSSTGLSPLKVFETLACGVPVVVTDFPGQADIVREHEVGHIVPPDDAGSLARAVSHLANNPETAKAMGARGRELIVRQYSWDAKAAATSEIVAAVLQRPTA